VEKILIPLDGSEEAYRALDFALDLAKTNGATVWVMYVLNKDIHNEIIQNFFPDDLEVAIKAAHIKDEVPTYVELVSRAIFKKAEEMAKTKGVDIHVTSNMGDPAKKIIAFSKNMKFDLIVMGKTGLGKARRYLFGSVSDKVYRHAPCSVTIVR
jgi:nucleotide-binding universal stress UspA family protein